MAGAEIRGLRAPRPWRGIPPSMVAADHGGAPARPAGRGIAPRLREPGDPRPAWRRPEGARTARGKPVFRGGCRESSSVKGEHDWGAAQQRPPCAGRRRAGWRRAPSLVLGQRHRQAALRLIFPLIPQRDSIRGASPAVNARRSALHCGFDRHRHAPLLLPRFFAGGSPCDRKAVNSENAGRARQGKASRFENAMKRFKKQCRKRAGIPERDQEARALREAVGQAQEEGAGGEEARPQEGRGRE